VIARREIDILLLGQIKYSDALTGVEDGKECWLFPWRFPKWEEG
jgi:hypothetical protein